MNGGFKEGLTELFKDTKDSTELKDLVDHPSHDTMMIKPQNDSITFYLDIFPAYFTHQYCFTDGRESKFVKYIDRDSLYSCEKLKSKLNQKCKYSKDIKYFDESNFDILYLTNKRKTILGYDCFKIIVKPNDDWEYVYEMYVTDQINLNYNYTINFKNLNEKYMILELMKKTSVEGNYSGFYTNSIELNK